MIGKISNSFTAILHGYHTTIAVTTYQLSAYKAHNYCCAVSVGALEFWTPENTDLPSIFSLLINLITGNLTLSLSTRCSPAVVYTETVPWQACREGVGLPLAGCLSVEPCPYADTNCEMHTVMKYCNHISGCGLHLNQLI